MEFLPDIMTFENGEKVNSAVDFEKRQKELIDILSRRAYGCIPESPKNVRLEETYSGSGCAGFAVVKKFILHADTGNGEAVFPFHMFLPDNNKKNPLAVMLNFNSNVYDKYYPAEEIISKGFALAVVNYADIATDDGDFTNGIAPLFTKKNDGTAPGKISLWAWGASRIIDAFYNDDRIDNKNIAVAGHSRLGKTALWCGANDKRVKFVFDNNSGCMGDSLEGTRHEGGETQKRISEVFPYWFCDNFNNDIKNGIKLPFDQHFLMAAIAPRYVFAGSAEKDDWADQYSQQLCCIAATPAWKIFGRQGYVGQNERAKTGESFNKGDICYHVRAGAHYFSRVDWNEYLDCANSRK